MTILTLYLLSINVIAFWVYGLDKQKAKQNCFRIPEKVLLGFAVVGGSVGAYTGMYVFRHKTKKVKFFIGIPLIIFLQIALVVYLKFL